MAPAVMQIALPASLILFMVGLGLSLEPHDFRTIFERPRAAACGLFAQLVLLPATAFAIAYLGRAPSYIAIGLILVACSPGGPSSNFLTFVARGDTALSIALTATSSLATVFTLPPIVSAAFALFRVGNQATVRLPILRTMAQIALLVVLPLAFGMALRARQPTLCDRLSRQVRRAALVFLAVIVVVLLVEQRTMFLRHGPAFGGYVLALLGGTMFLGAAVARLLRQPRPQRIAIVLEVGMQNAAQAITVAASPLFLDDRQLAIAPTLYGLFMYGAAFSYLALLRVSAGR